MTVIGLTGMAVGSFMLAMMPVAFGIPAYIALIVITVSYALFQTANNTAVMTDLRAERGVIAGLISLSRNLGLITGASVMGAVLILVALGSRVLARRHLRLA